MHTVYGIYETGHERPLYIGCTMLPLRVRMSGHRTDGVMRYVNNYNDWNMSDRARLKSYWMFKEAAGVVSLEIRAISKHHDRERALAKEARLLRKHRPILNCVFPSYQTTINRRAYSKWLSEYHQQRKAA